MSPFLEGKGVRLDPFIKALTKDSFLRELREVAPEVELFPENHSPYEKDFVTKSNPYAKFSARHFTKKYLEEYVRKVARHIFLTETLSQTLL